MPVARTLLGRPARFAGGWCEVSGGVYAWLQPNGELGESNAGLVVGDGEALLVDTLWDERLTRRMLDARPGIDAGPITRVVNTHGDGDHVWGNALLPDAEIVATAGARDQVREEAPAGLVAFARLAAVTSRLPPGPGRLGAPRRLGRYAGPLLAPYDFAGVHRVAPSRSFSGELEIDVGGREVRLIQVGPAHTAGDLIVHVPDADVVFAADVLFVGVTPIAWTGPISRWLEALRTIDALAPGTVVPGHGPLAGDPEVELMRRYWTWLAAEVRARGERFASSAALARDVLFGEGRTGEAFAAQPWAAWDAPERLLVNVAAIRHEQEHGRPRHVGPLGRLRLFAGMADLAAELERRR